MRFYIMHRGVWEEIPVSGIRDHATVFMAKDRRSLKRVKFFSGKCAGDTEFWKVKKLLETFTGKLRIKVCGPATFWGSLVGVEKNGGDYYLVTEVIAGKKSWGRSAAAKAYCLSWVANYPSKDALCVSFKIFMAEEEKK
ncbi:MAG: hypothetical protein PHR36_01310 [Patescibacteria group bacterium]|nr:hypothetical protein [Patescibacteria group bacterium]